MRITQFERIAPLLLAAAIGGCAPMSGGTRPSAENNNSPSQPNANLNGNANININMNSGPPPSPLTGEPGAPISPLTAGERAMFDAGRGLFEHEFTSSEGLGPQLNATSCRACHDQGGTGGGGARYRNTYVVARSNSDGTVSRIYSTFFLPAYGPSQIFPSYAGDDHPPTPATADIVAQRNPPALFGIGLLELVSDQTLMNLQDPDDANADGISGRVNLVDTQIGRFGYKAQGVSIEAFTRGTLQEHSGITSDPLPPSAARSTSHGWLRRSLDKFVATLSIASPAYAQVIGPGPPPSGDGDSVPEPEMIATNLRTLIAFQQKLAAPLRGAITDAVQRGEALFQQTGCDACHVAT
ncbi:MAG TPA: di-heme oxidoredictase family protein, partial [Phycisphaerae bacterium]